MRLHFLSVCVSRYRDLLFLYAPNSDHRTERSVTTTKKGKKVAIAFRTLLSCFKIEEAEENQGKYQSK
jgi:hypothetical protein